MIDDAHAGRATPLASGLVILQAITQLLLVIARWLAVTLPAFLQRGRDDFLARIDLASVNQRPESAAIVGNVITLLFVEAGPEEIDRHLEFVNQFSLDRMARLSNHDAECLKILFIQPV